MKEILDDAVNLLKGSGFNIIEENEILTGIRDLNMLSSTDIVFFEIKRELKEYIRK